MAAEASGTVGPVVACVSGGPGDEPVLVGAARLSRALGAPYVIAVHVVDTSILPGPPDTLEGRVALQGLRARALEVLEAARSALEGLGVDSIAVAREGQPCREIVDFAEKAEPSALVLGVSDRGGQLGGTVSCVLGRYRGTMLVAKPRAATI